VSANEVEGLEGDQLGGIDVGVHMHEADTALVIIPSGVVVDTIRIQTGDGGFTGRSLPGRRRVAVCSGLGG